ncbi:MAG: chromosome segregation protein SMC [Oligoflexia bacterium]|nr:chromosome segregation protein SMC [Oligoflexia bacterium]
MQVRRLELQGFKSFKDKTVIHFEDGITGIVGPNGCGKSNVVDAFFWVMGEQNARHLRGQSMDDLIFSGADKAPPASWAEVTMVLDMPSDLSGPNAPAGASLADPSLDGKLPTREVAITRRLYRTGESDYFINKNPCRLRDIQELFMDTGVGARGYSIIQQGMIAKIVQAKPEDRRTMIEEVAGIVKYKARRKESMRKLEYTNQNLLRVTDVINELEIQKKQMERQAEKAKKYKEWNDRLQQIEVQFNALKWQDATLKQGSINNEITALSAEDATLTTARETAETEISQKRLELAQASNVSEEFQKAWMEAGKKLNDAENDLKYSQKNLDDSKNAQEQLQKNLLEEENLVAEVNALHEAILAETESLTQDLQAAEEKKSTLETSLLEKKHLLDSELKSLEAAKKSVYQNESEREKTKNKIDFAKERIQIALERLSSFETEKAQIDATYEDLTNELNSASSEVEQVRLKIQNNKENQLKLAEELAIKNKTLSEERKEKNELNSNLARAKTTLETLEEQKRRHDGASKGVKSIFQKYLAEKPELANSIKGTVSDFLTVQNGLETAVEAILGKYVDLVVGTDSHTLETISTKLREDSSGRAAFLNLSESLAQPEMISSIQCPEEHQADYMGSFYDLFELSLSGLKEHLQNLLGPVFVTKNSETAKALATTNPRATFVSTTGEICRGNWYLEGGDQSTISGASVTRVREIESLQAQVQELENSILSKQELITELEMQILALNEQNNEYAGTLQNAQSELTNASSKQATLQARKNEFDKTLNKIAQEGQKLNDDLNRFRTEETDAHSILDKLISSESELIQEVTRLEAIVQERNTELETLSKETVDSRVRFQNLNDQKLSIDRRLSQSETNLRQNRNRLDSTRHQIQVKQEEQKITEEKIQEISGQLDALRSSLIDSESTYRQAKERYDLLNHEVEELRSAAQGFASNERALKDRLLDKRLEQQKVEGELESLNQNTFERYGLVLAEYCVMPEVLELIQALRDSGEIAIQETQNEVHLLREKIRKLGPVNHAAVEEYDAIVERYNLLSTQKADLEVAMADLQTTVDKINFVSKERFERAFTEVNTHFKKVFPVIFGGGHAHLTLTNPEDLLETGVDITAQPPGKKAQNINLLSGGEKTLTAISLLFSIFLVKPSPFCLLDEVDAPLDDANIGRFNALLREMSKRSQFIIITHNKRTMELNDKLYGVTMEDAGISKMVSIQLSANV